ncbi:unnamed protein product, partial [marine sediment metagenome]
MDGDEPSSDPIDCTDFMIIHSHGDNIEKLKLF